MLGTTFQKPLTDYAAYSAAAGWANENNAMIVDQGSHYEVVEVPLPTSEQREQAIRAERDVRLRKADYAINMAEDAGLDTEALRQYRQALRDVPQQPGFPDSVVWPEQPEGGVQAAAENEGMTETQAAAVPQTA